MCVCLDVRCVVFFFFKQKTAYEMRISDWNSDVCSSDLLAQQLQRADQRLDVVAVDRPGVVEAHLLEQRGRHEHALPVLLPAAHEPGRSEIGRASWRARECQYVLNAVGA